MSSFAFVFDSVVFNRCAGAAPPLFLFPAQALRPDQLAPGFGSLADHKNRHLSISLELR